MTTLTAECLRAAISKLDAAAVPLPYVMWHQQFGFVHLDRDVVDSVLMTPRKMQ